MPQQQRPSSASKPSHSPPPAPSTILPKPTHNINPPPHQLPPLPKRSTSKTKPKPHPLLAPNAKFLAQARKINAEKAAVRAAAEAAKNQLAKTDSRSAERQLEDQLAKLTMTQVPKGSSVDCAGGKDLKKDVDTDGGDGRGDEAREVPKEGTFSWAMRLVREGESGGG
ncbi:MAG: hypothetical protein Q9180_005974 [Flavoplaca navasiana]